MFIDTRSPRKKNDVAFLQTYFMPSIDYCLDLNYHMFGVRKDTAFIATIFVHIVVFAILFCMEEDSKKPMGSDAGCVGIKPASSIIIQNGQTNHPLGHVEITWSAV